MTARPVRITRSLPNLRISRWVPLPPDPTLPEVLTKSEYPLPHAVAELVDNSIDSGASEVVIRLIRSANRLESLQVIDNGNGIEPVIFDEIMRFGYKSPHKESDVGMYGVGLKTSSLSQADRLWVISAVRGKIPHGRELIKSKLSDEELGVIASEDAQEAFRTAMSARGSEFKSEFGTVVEWRDVKDFLRSEESVEAYLKQALLDLESHCGLVFHRFIEKEQCSIYVEVQQELTVVSRVVVKAINPFNYPKSGIKGWPKTMTLTIARGPGEEALQVDVIAHIWPPRTKVPEYKIRRVGGRTNTIDSQGLYFYLNDRLLIAGGWSNIRTPEAHLALARMEITLTPELQKVVEVVYTKDKAMVPQSFIQALRTASASDGTTYSEWIDLAQELFRTPSTDAPKLPRLPLPGQGMPSSFKEEVMESGFPIGEQVGLKWSRLPSELVFRVDRKRKLLILNEEFRRKLRRKLGGDSGIDVMVTVLLHSLREHFGDRTTTRLAKIEKMMNKTIKSVLE